MKKIQLIYPQGGSKLSSSGILPPIGIVSLATYLKNKNPDIEIELFDGELTNQDEILKKIDGELIGLSLTGANYHNALKLAKKAKSKGIGVVVGGPHATIKHKEILKKQKSIDAVIRGDGEAAFYDYVQAVLNKEYNNLKKIMNLSYKKENNIITNPLIKRCEQININYLPTPNYLLLGKMISKYKKNFQGHSYKKRGFTKFASLESQKGCAKTLISNKKSRCTFCARIDKGLRRLNPEEFWKRVLNLYNPDGKTMIWDFSDSFTGSFSKTDNWVMEVAKKKPSFLENKVYFKIFARADELEQETVKYIKQIGVEEVFIGIESGDQEKLDLVNKGTTLENNLTAVENLKKYNIETYASFIYGLPGEDSKSLEKTLHHIEEVIQRGKIAGIGIRCLFPMAGMKVHSDLLRTMKKYGEIKLAEEIKQSDGYDSTKLQKLWIKYMTNTNIEEITKYHKKIMEITNSYNVRINDEKRLFLS